MCVTYIVLVLYIMRGIGHRDEILQECRIFLFFRLRSDMFIQCESVSSDNSGHRSGNSGLNMSTSQGYFMKEAKKIEIWRWKLCFVKKLIMVQYNSGFCFVVLAIFFFFFSYHNVVITIDRCYQTGWRQDSSLSRLSKAHVYTESRNTLRGW